MDDRSIETDERGLTAGELRARFEDERRTATRLSGLAGGVVAIIGLPAWSLFDYLVAPSDASGFLLIRLVATAVIAGFWLLLFTPLGHRRPELVGLGAIAPVQIAVGLMIVQLGDHHAAYALGMSLGIFASGFLVVWAVRYTLVLVAISFGTLLVGWLAVPEPVDVGEVATVAFFLLTASAIAVAGQVMLDRAAWREFESKSELEAEQARTRELVAKLDRLSYEDPLTGLANRRGWDETIDRECARMGRGGNAHVISVLLCDVDRLKEINDGLGHAMGDLVLQSVAKLLRSRARASDLVARFGGDEFAILAVGSDELEATKLGEDLRSLVQDEQVGGPAAGAVTISVGVASCDGDDDTPEALMLRADRRLYAAKARRNVVCAGDPVESAG